MYKPYLVFLDCSLCSAACSDSQGTRYRTGVIGVRVQLNVASLTVDRLDSDIIYATNLDGPTYISVDGAASWQETVVIPDETYRILTSYEVPRVLYAMVTVGDGRGVYRRDDDEGWDRIDGLELGSIAVDPEDGNHVFAWYEDRLYETSGGSFRALHTTDGGLRIHRLAVNTDDSSNIVMPLRDDDQEVQSLTYSLDGGVSWFDSSEPVENPTFELIFDETEGVFVVSGDDLLFESTNGDIWGPIGDLLPSDP